jgi:hypothetical protein
MSHSLSGKKCMNKINLSGKNHIISNMNPFQIHKLKIRIMNLYILPLLSKKWNKIKENLFLLDHLRDQIDKHYIFYKEDNILLYKDILNIFEILMDQHIQLKDMENNLYGKSSDSKNEIINMIYRTTMIKIKPEYELYDSIIGKPLREENKTYDENIITDIKKYMVLENVTYQMIQNYINNKYLINKSKQ